ncbi:hypothetical protein HanRHA438_Chr17g0797101 [Helianthus annuus]|nr:hypothetical protein HanLR1_Chr17g0651951 [Helianthus annuus]KAJ0635129.1 hypothetical protein HanOQP8_Chr17g0647501 [Helianthus annuus]KAJ0824873.1 hypothetical protein HanRHA438_Chr17g0797101 [Helianthus annuus]
MIHQLTQLLYLLLSADKLVERGGVVMAMASSGGSHTVFVYGSLLADDVVQVLLNRVPQVSPAILNG